MAEAQSILDTLVGRTIKSATMEETRIVVETNDGNRYYFYGLMGGGEEPHMQEAALRRS